MNPSMASALCDLFGKLLIYSFVSCSCIGSLLCGRPMDILGFTPVCSCVFVEHMCILVAHAISNF